MTNLAEILEIGMILAFGFSWPNNIITSLKNKSTKGKNPLFLILIDLGYVCGIASKFIMLHEGASVKWYVLFFYFLNFAMVSWDLFLYCHYLSKEKKAK